MLCVFSVSWGYGKSHNVAWYAAVDAADAQQHWRKQFPHRQISEIRKTACLRAVREGDEVTSAGPIVFAGFGVAGPVRAV